MENQNKQHPKTSGRECISLSPAVQSPASLPEQSQPTIVRTPHEVRVDSSPTQSKSSSRGHISLSPVVQSPEDSQPTIIPAPPSPTQSKSCSSEHISLSPTIKSPVTSPEDSPARSSVSIDNTSLTHGSYPGEEEAPKYLTEKSPAAVEAVLNRDVREEPMAAITKTDPVVKNVSVMETKKSGGSGTGRRKVMPSLSILRTTKREKMVKKAALGFRVFGFLFCLVSFSVMAADRNQGWALDSFESYKEFRYCMSVNVIGFVYSGAQAIDLSHNLATGKYIVQYQPELRHYFDFAVDQIISYLLISASSSAATRIDDWQSNWGNDEFPNMARIYKIIFRPDGFATLKCGCDSRFTLILKNLGTLALFSWRIIKTRRFNSLQADQESQEGRKGGEKAHFSMPGYVMEGSNGVEEHIGQYAMQNENFNHTSPRSPSSTQSSESDSIDLAIEQVIETSIEQLYHNVCDMQSSDLSPSRCSFLSYGEESRIDSELRYLAGAYYGDLEVKDEAVTDKSEGDPVFQEDKGSRDDKLGKTNKIRPASVRSISPTGANEVSPMPSLRSRSFMNIPQNGKRNVKTPRKLNSVSSFKNEWTPRSLGSKMQNGNEDPSEVRYLGPYLLKQARDLIASGDNYQKALDLALRAMKSFDISPNSKPNLEFVMCMHIVAALYCRLGQYTAAIPVLERSVEIPDMDLGQNHAFAKFAGCMQLGDTYAMLGQIENSILCYTAGLEIQRQVLGEKDPRFGDSCRYLAEAHVQAMQFDEAEKLCLIALDIRKENGVSASPEEAADRRLLGLICESKGDYEGSLEHYVLAGMAMAANGQNADVAAIDCNIGDAYLSLAKYDEAIFSYQKALNMFKSTKGENHPSVASVYVRLADLYNKIGKFSESKSYSKNALRIYSKPFPGSPAEEIASGLVDISAIYESMNEPDRALKLLQKAIKVYGNSPGQQSTIAGIEAQMGVLYYVLGSFLDSYNAFKNAVSKFRAIGEKKSAIFGIALNQMGLACVQLYSINEAADLFEEARNILETEYGPYHADTLGVYSNLAGTYDAMGRTADAIEILEYVVEMREEKLGTANPDVDDEKQRLSQLLKEAGTVRNRKSKSLKTLQLSTNTPSMRTSPTNIRQSVLTKMSPIMINRIFINVLSIIIDR
ncbi:Uncharacterized protein Fot_21471 [Forsythia ovata]|uniref:Casparian strip membrane protein domain-containing protein n=1 Tax=Forsythia ovata TaxID=205694 RepID=A0ABD1UUX7_9LAMI